MVYSDMDYSILSLFISISPCSDSRVLEWQYWAAKLTSILEKSDTLFGELSAKIRPGKNQVSLEKADFRTEAEKLDDEPGISCAKSKKGLREYWGYVRRHGHKREDKSVLGQLYHQNK